MGTPTITYENCGTGYAAPFEKGAVVFTGEIAVGAEGELDAPLLGPLRVQMVAVDPSLGALLMVMLTLVGVAWELDTRTSAS